MRYSICMGQISSIRLILALVVFSCIGCNGGNTQQATAIDLTHPAPHSDALMACPNQNEADQYARLKSYILSLKPQLAMETNVEVIERTLRDMAYLEFAFGDNEVADMSQVDIGYQQRIEDKTSTSRCWGISFFYRHSLQAFGIPTRYVALFKSMEPIISHAAVEAKLNGKWVVSDPTFNIELTGIDGQRIGYAEALSQSYSVVYGVQNNAYPLRNITEAEFRQYLNWVAIYPGPGETLNSYYPAEWDGHIRWDGNDRLMAIGESQTLTAVNEQFACASRL